MTSDNISFTQMRSRFMFDEKDNDITTKALVVLGELCNWFEQNHPDCTSKPNLRVGREVLCVCLGESCIWNSQENYLEELTCDWMLKAYEKDLRERLEIVEKWKLTTQQVYIGPHPPAVEICFVDPKIPNFASCHCGREGCGWIWNVETHQWDRVVPADGAKEQ